MEENNSNSRGLMRSIRDRVPAKARVENVEKISNKWNMDRTDRLTRAGTKRELRRLNAEWRWKRSTTTVSASECEPRKRREESVRRLKSIRPKEARAANQELFLKGIGDERVEANDDLRGEEGRRDSGAGNSEGLKLGLENWGKTRWWVSGIRKAAK